MMDKYAAGEKYDRLWTKAVTHFQSSQVGIDPYLRDKADDRRLGISVIARPGPDARARFTSFLDQVKQIEPDQYFYRESEYHLTILSLFTATEAFEPLWANLEGYRAAVNRALLNSHAFTVRYEGITASKSAVMVQGFAEGRYLNQLRADLRRALGVSGLGDGLDQRYAIDTAHSTVFRFISQPKNMPRLLDLLRVHRTTNFGETTFHHLQLVRNDWYMSREKVEILAQYALTGR
jgi:2'-5' RNA ligase